MIRIESEFVYLAAATAIALAGATFDLKSRRIPNFITGPALLLGLGLHVCLDGWRGLLSALGACMICGAIFLMFYLAGGMGAGDVKLMAAAGCVAGLPNAASLLALTAIAGGVMAVALALARGRMKETLSNVLALTKHHGESGLTPHPEINVLNSSTLRLPYGLAIAAGCSITFYLSGMQR